MKNTFFAALVGGALALTWGASQSALAAPVAAKRADDFVASVAISAAFHQASDTDFNTLKTRLDELDIRTVRSGVITSNRANLVSRAQALGNLGIKSNLVFDSRKSNGTFNTDTYTPAEAVQLIKDIGPAFCIAEGPNEPEHSNDEWRFSYNNFDWPNTQGLKDYTRDMWNALQADSATRNVPVLPASLLGTNIGDQSAYINFGNLHSYATGIKPLYGFTSHLDAANNISGAKPVMATETGYSTALNMTDGFEVGDKPVPEDIQAKFLLRTYFLFWNRGIARTYVYRLMDSPDAAGQISLQNHWGIVHADGTPKPAFNGIKNLISILNDATFNSTTKNWDSPVVAPASLDYSLAGDLSEIDQTLLQKNDGRFYLILTYNATSYHPFSNTGQQIYDGSGRRTVSNRAITLTVPSSISRARAFSPYSGTAATELPIAAGQVALSVPDHPLIIELTPGGNGTGLTAQYFDNSDLTVPKNSRVDATVNFNWDSGTPPGTGISNADTFSAQWTGEVQAQEAGTYTFSTTADDGVRLWVNGTQLINRWSNGSTTNSGTITLAANTKYLIRLEYFENIGGALISLKWKRPGQTATVVVPQSQLYPSVGVGNTGLKGQYFSGPQFTSLVTTRTDSKIDFNWDTGGPMSSVGPDSFSVRWTGKVTPRYSQSYTFSADVDDNATLWINGQQIFNGGWGVVSGTTATLTAGQAYDIRVDYKEGSGDARIKLWWESASQAQEIVPQSQLAPAP